MNLIKLNKIYELYVRSANCERQSASGLDLDVLHCGVIVNSMFSVFSGLESYIV